MLALAPVAITTNDKFDALVPWLPAARDVGYRAEAGAFPPSLPWLRVVLNATVLQKFHTEGSAGFVLFCV